MQYLCWKPSRWSVPNCPRVQTKESCQGKQQGGVEACSRRGDETEPRLTFTDSQSQPSTDSLSQSQQRCAITWVQEAPTHNFKEKNFGVPPFLSSIRESICRKPDQHETAGLVTKRDSTNTCVCDQIPLYSFIKSWDGLFLR